MKLSQAYFLKEALVKANVEVKDLPVVSVYGRDYIPAEEVKKTMDEYDFRVLECNVVQSCFNVE